MKKILLYNQAQDDYKEVEDYNDVGEMLYKEQLGGWEIASDMDLHDKIFLLAKLSDYKIDTLITSLNDLVLTLTKIIK